MKLSFAGLLAVVVALVPGWGPGRTEAGYVSTVVMSGLDNPRGLAFGPGGVLYVAEAGRGGPGPSIVLGEGTTNYFGTSGAVSRLQGGCRHGC